MDHISDIGCTHVVAVDGAYALYPHDQVSSDPDQAEAIIDGCRANDLGLVLCDLKQTWIHNEIQKRQYMLDVAKTIATGVGDWLMPWDADFHLEQMDFDLFDKLRSGKSDFWDIEISDAPTGDVGWWWVRLFLRAHAIEGFVRNHYTYALWDGTETVVGPRAADLVRGRQTTMRIRHKPNNRVEGRRERQVEYYEQRHALKIES